MNKKGIESAVLKAILILILMSLIAFILIIVVVNVKNRILIV